jgi:hypothetical protein
VKIRFISIKKLLCSLESKFLKLTKKDDEIYKEFRDLFKEFDVGLITEDELKSTASKEVCFKGYFSKN